MVNTGGEPPAQGESMAIEGALETAPQLVGEDWGTEDLPQDEEYRTQQKPEVDPNKRFVAAMGILFAIAVLYLIAMFLGQCGGTSGLAIFESTKEILVPITTLVLGSYWGQATRS